MKGLPAETDFVVIGAGVAGLRAAIELAAAGRVLVLEKNEVEPNLRSPVSALSDEEEVILHLQDTLSAGDGLSNSAAVKLLLEEGPERIEELIAWTKHHGTKLLFGLESAHSRQRSLHALGESTGREILRALHAKADSLKHISFAPFVFTTGLLTDGGQVSGISSLDGKGVPQEVACSAVLLATGGMGQLYRNTTNPEASTADGVALAYLAGAEVSDMEFVQFHSTALYMKKVPRFLLPEELRAEGACLRNIELNRFMGKYHPMGEQAPRDLVARAIVHDLMESEVGIVRTRMGMQKAIKSLEDMAPKLAHPKTRRAHEASNLHLAGLLVARSALAREESRGAHYRMDYPDHDDKKFLKHSVIRGEKVVFLP